jgi:hypothetical protein
LAAAEGRPDIKDQILITDMSQRDAGYKANYGDSGVDFTIFARNSVYRYTIRVAEGVERRGSEDTYFRVTGATGENQIYVTPFRHDSYYINGYQTLLVNDSGLNIAGVKPIFWLGNETEAYVGTKQTSGESAQDFSGGPVQYSAKASDGRTVKNYWVSFIKKESAPKLFVNGPDEREVYLNSYYGFYHDIFLANVGGEILTGLNVTLDGAQNIKLDEYWTVGGEGNAEIAAFDAVTDNTAYGEIPSVAKIRLVPDGEGEINGTLTIAADGQESRVVTLTGIAGNPKIVTEGLDDAVKFVPYSFLVATNNMHDWNKVTFNLNRGTLPQGLNLLPNGEIYGVPTEAGVFEIQVRAYYSHSEFADSYADFTLTVHDNTDENVEASTDEGYGITVRVPETMDTARNTDFEIEGAFNEFMDLWLDGEKLERNVAYTAKDGSTNVTLQWQTFRNAGIGTHTIAAEYRVDGDRSKELRRAAQNYTLESLGSGGGPSGGGGVVNSSGGNASGSGAAPTPTPTPIPAPAPAGSVTGPAPTAGVSSRFADVSPTDGFYSDVEYAASNGWLVGVSADRFAPSKAVTRGMLATILARMYGADTGAYTEGADDFSDVPGDRYYAYAVRWARAIGLIAGVEGNRFEPDTAVSRQDLAVLLDRFSALMGKPLPVTRQIVAFADEGDVAGYALESLRTMYRAGVVSGAGNDRINPQSAATRAEIAAMLRRFQQAAGA